MILVIDERRVELAALDAHQVLELVSNGAPKSDPAAADAPSGPAIGRSEAT
ncbi:hypothetical protein GCM10009557_44910 [Virgisporangium ochraceum]|uniref:Uncharacterized protein n=1 Tax=Virgisporangium ochraceum TaxID=65505 RepID=A0A8J3ZRG4_9ACTN|nr:hypothetical protein Voc01_026040 [Virgisporangium ochraceum]